MSKNQDIIIIQDWTGKTLFEGNYKSEDVDIVLTANRCLKCGDNREDCLECDGTGYWGDFEVYWAYPDSFEDIENLPNVYECINY